MYGRELSFLVHEVEEEVMDTNKLVLFVLVWWPLLPKVTLWRLSKRAVQSKASAESGTFRASYTQQK